MSFRRQDRIMKTLKFLFAFIFISTSLLAQSPVTRVSADTGGLFWERNGDSLFVRNTTWVGKDSAAAKSDCVYTLGKNPRMMARDSMHIEIEGKRSDGYGWIKEYTIRTGETIHTDWWGNLNDSLRFTISEVSAPSSECGVNAGQVTFTWKLKKLPL